MGGKKAEDLDEEDFSKMGKLEILRKLKEMKQLDFSQQNLTAVPDEACQAFPYMSNVVLASFARNSFSDLPSSVGKLKALQFLQLNENQFVHLPRCLGHLPNVVMLDLRNNKLVDLDPTIVKKWGKLQKLMLRYNRISAIPREIKYCSNLKLLSLRNNSLIRVPIEINELSKLGVLDLRNNQLKSLPPLSNLMSLSELDLQHNALSSLPEEVGRMQQVTRMSLGYNNLQFPEFVCSMVSLTELDLEHNVLTYVPEAIGNMANLRVLYLSRNHIAELPATVSKLTNLERLFLRDCEFSAIPDGLAKLESCKKLVELDMRQNPLDFVKNNDTTMWATILKNFSWVPELRLDETYNPNKADYMQSLDRRSRSVAAQNAPRKSSIGVLMDMFSWGWGGSSTPAPEPEKPKEEAKSSDLADLSALAADLPDGDDSVTRATAAKAKAQPGEPIVRAYYCKTDTNERGLTRGKKDVIQNEDNHCEHFPFMKTDSRGLFCVLDGHAGKGAAEAATKMLPAEIEKELKEADKQAKKSGKPHPDDYSEEMHMAFIATDNQMSEFEYEGCTATAVFVWRNGEGLPYAIASGVGDSTVYLVRGDDFLALSEDHKLENMYERARIEAAGVYLSEHATRIAGLSVTRALGDWAAKAEHGNAGMIGVPYICDPIELLPGDTHIVIATDGLWDVCTPDEAVKVVRENPTPEKIAKKLVSAAVKNLKCTDNITVTVIELATS